MAIYVLDETGTLLANRVQNERRETLLESQRIFVPEAGAFFVSGFSIRNAANGQLLEPGIQYITLEMEEELALRLGKNVCSVVYVKDLSIKSVIVNYQAVGGEYQYTASKVESLLSNFLDGTSDTNLVGSLVAVPNQLPPMTHMHLGNTTYGFNEAVFMLDQISQALKTGDSAMYEHLYQYIDESIKDSEDRMFIVINELGERVDSLDTRSEIRIGRFIFTDDPRNPNTYLGYGEWVLNPNVFLYGANEGDTVGDLIYISSGSGAIGRKTYIWQRVEFTGAISYRLSANTGIANEGDTVTFTLETTGLTAGTPIAYRITGVQAEDIAGGRLTGNFLIGPSGVGTLEVDLLEDMLTEGQETLRLALTSNPNILVNVIVNDTSKSPAVALRWSANANGSGTITSVNEGSPAYLIITASNIVGTVDYNLRYNNSTALDADFERPSGVSVDGLKDGATYTNNLPTRITVGNGTTIVEYRIKNDYLTEGNEVLVTTIQTLDGNSNLATTSLTIRDTSLTPTFNSFFSASATAATTITETNEGTTVYFRYTWTEQPSSQVVYVNYSGVQADDFVGAVASTLLDNKPITLSAAGGSGSITLPILADAKTEGRETLRITLTNGSGTVLTTANLNINDTSINPTYNLKFSSNTGGTDTITSANEGVTAYAILTTTNIANGTTLNITYGGTSNAADFTTTRPTSVVVQNNSATVPLSIKADSLTEGSETCIVSFFNGGVAIASGTLIINDTSVAPVYGIKFSANANGTGTITSVNEGATGYIVVTTQNVANNTTLYLTYTSVVGTVNNDDFTTTRPATVVISNNQAIIPFTVRNDLTTEGNETMRVSLRTASATGTVVDTADIVINDTSVPTFSVHITGTNNINGSVLTTTNEGTTVYVVIRTSGIANGTVVNLAYNLNQDDFATTLPATATINNDSAIVPISILNDYRTDGNKTLVVQVLRSNAVMSSASISIVDTSKATSISARWSANANGSGTITNRNEGLSAWLVINTQNLPNGKVINLSYTGVQAADFDVAPPATTTVTNNQAIVEYKIKADNLYEGPETCVVTAQIREGSTVISSTTASLLINDTSQPAIGVAYYASNRTTVVTSLNEGETYYLGIDMRAFAANTAYSLSFSGTGALQADYVTSGMTDIIFPRAAAWDKASISSGIQFFPIQARPDLTTDGNKTLNTTLSIGGTVRATANPVTIVDTSKTPGFEMYFASNNTGATAITQINEGTNCFLIIKYSNANTVLRYAVENSMRWAVNTIAIDWDPVIGGYHVGVPNSSGTHCFIGRSVADRNITRNAYESFTLTTGENKILAIPLEFIADKFDGGDKVFTMTLHSGLDNNALSNAATRGLVATATITVKDTSVPTITTTIPAAGGLYDEGTTGNYSITIESLAINANNSFLAVRRTSGSASQDDLTMPAVVKVGTISNANSVNARGTFILPVSYVNDFLTEGNENIIFDMMLFHRQENTFIGATNDATAGSVFNFNTVVTSGSVQTTTLARKTKLSRTITINDTSRTPGYDAFYAMSSSAAKTAAVTSVNEGTTFYLIILTTNLPNNHKLALSYQSGSGFVDNNDFSTARPTEVTVTNNRAVVTFTTSADLIVEGAETLRTFVKNEAVSNTNVVTANVTVQDTSVPTYEIYYSSDAAGNTRITQANEGTSGYVQVRTAGVANNTTLYTRWVGANNVASTVQGADWDTPPPNTFIIQSNRASAAWKLKNDMLEEGDEIQYIALATTNSNNTIVSNRASLLVKDTSIPNWTIGGLNSVNEGVQISLDFYREGGQTGAQTTYVRFTIPGLTAAQVAARFDGTLPTSFSLNNTGAGTRINLTPRFNYVTDGDKVVTVQVSDDINFGKIRATKTFTIVDVSRTPTISLLNKYSANMVYNAATLTTTVYVANGSTGNTDGGIYDPFTSVYAASHPLDITDRFNSVINLINSTTHIALQSTTATTRPGGNPASSHVQFEIGREQYGMYIVLRLAVTGLKNGDYVFAVNGSTSGGAGGTAAENAWWSDNKMFVTSDNMGSGYTTRREYWRTAAGVITGRNYGRVQNVTVTNGVATGEVYVLLRVCALKDIQTQASFANRPIYFNYSTTSFTSGATKFNNSVPLTFRRVGRSTEWGAKSDVNGFWLNPQSWVDTVITGGGGGGGGSTRNGDANVGWGTDGTQTVLMMRLQKLNGGNLDPTQGMLPQSLIAQADINNGYKLMAIAFGGFGGSPGNANGGGGGGGTGVLASRFDYRLDQQDFNDCGHIWFFSSFYTTTVTIPASSFNDGAYTHYAPLGNAWTRVGPNGIKVATNQAGGTQISDYIQTLTRSTTGTGIATKSVQSIIRFLGNGGGGGDRRGTNEWGFGGGGGAGGSVRTHIRYVSPIGKTMGPIYFEFRRGAGGIGGRAGGYPLTETTANTWYAERSGKNGERGGSYIVNGGGIPTNSNAYGDTI